MTSPSLIAMKRAKHPWHWDETVFPFGRSPPETDTRYLWPLINQRGFDHVAGIASQLDFHLLDRRDDRELAAATVL
jgi:hypothetical protein